MLEARLPAGGLGGLRVLDLYAGSGALGLEALSRGAAEAVLVDSSRAAQRAILENARRLDFAAACSVLALPVEVALQRLAAEGRCFELVLADPPYAEDPRRLLDEVGRSKLLAGEGILALEHSVRNRPAESGGGLRLLVRRRHGDTELSLFARAPICGSVE
jgi:16S rRNA (guanine966-N2)-methyltransferase